MNSPIDLGLGNLECTKEYWASQSSVIPRILPVPAPYDVSYNFGSDVTKFGPLEDTLRELHSRYKNGITTGKELVVGHGACHVLSAAMYAHSCGNVKTFRIKAPYWAKIKRFHQMSCMGSSSQFEIGESYIADPAGCDVIVYPNNPDGERRDLSQLSPQMPRIIDLCYNWPQFGEPGNLDEPTMIYSFAKATGLANMRFGWAFVSNPETALLMKEYISFSTGGVSAAVANTVQNLLKFQLESHYTIFDFIKQKLEDRRARVPEIQRALGEHAEILTNKGMFVWGRMKQPIHAQEWFAKNFGVQVTSGSTLSASDDHFRINLAVSDEIFNQFMERLSIEQLQRELAL